MFFSHVEVRRENDNNPDESYLNHKWTLEAKITLAILAGWYLNSWQERTLIFNAYIQGADSPLNQGLHFSENVLRTKWWHLRNGEHTNGIKEISQYDTTFSDTSVAWAATRASLEEAAKELGITIHKRTTESRTHTLQTPRHTRVVKRKRQNHSPGPEFSNDEEGMVPRIKSRSFIHNRVKTRQGTFQSYGGLLTPLSPLPRYAFRAFNSTSQGLNSPRGFRAGRFKHSTAIPPSPETQSPQYCEDALMHINSLPNGSTPFISVTRNLLRALHHGFKTAFNSSIAVIDLHKVERLDLDGEKRFLGTVQSVRALNLKSPDGYSGSGEYLVWGEITENAVVSCQTITHLVSSLSTSENDCPFYFNIIRSSAYSTAARNHIKKACTPLTSYTGKAVGELLRALYIPASRLDDAIYAVISDWRFNATKSGQWRKNRHFMTGVREGFEKIDKEFPLPKSYRKGLLDVTPNEEISSENPEEVMSDDGLALEDTEDDQGNERSQLQAEGRMFANKTMEITSPEDVIREGGVINNQALKDAFYHDIYINRADDGQLKNANVRDEMDCSTLSEDVWDEAFLQDIEEILDMDKNASK